MLLFACRGLGAGAEASLGVGYVGLGADQKERSSSIAVETFHVHPAPPPLRFFFHASPPSDPADAVEDVVLEKDDLVLKTGAA